jgi:ankyrin repeat protein
LLAAGAQVDGFDGEKAMRHALKNDHLAIMKLLVTNGADINLREDPFVSSLLMVAAEQGNVRFVKFLLEHGAYTKFRNRDGKTASLLASEAGHREIVDLINNHAD